MFKLAVVILAVIACASANPGLLAYTSPVLAAAPAPLVTATSSQVFTRNYNGVAHAPVIAPVATHFAAPLAAPLAAPVIAKYAAAPLAAPLAYSSPLTYTAAAAPVLL